MKQMHSGICELGQLWDEYFAAIGEFMYKKSFHKDCSVQQIQISLAQNHWYVNFISAPLYTVGT